MHAESRRSVTSPRQDDVVNLEDHADALGGEGERACRDEGWLQHIGLVHIHNGVLLDVQAGVFVSSSVAIAQLGHKDDWVETGVFTESVGDELEGLSICSAHVRVRSEDLSGVLGQLVRDFHLDAGTSWNERSLLNESTHDTESIMEGALSLIDDELVGTSQENGDSLTLVRASSDLDNFLGASSADFLADIGLSELFLGELVWVGNWDGVDGSADEVNLVAVDVLDHHDLLLGQEVESQVRDGLAENTLLEEQNVGSTVYDLLNQSQDVLSLFLEETVDSGVVVHDDVALEVTLGGGEWELNETDFGTLNAGWATSEVTGLLVDKDESVNELALVDSAAQFLGNVDVSEVDVVGSLLVNDLEDSLNCHWGELVGVMRDNLG
jgi:hypothetical protein